jgi:transposase
VRHRPDHPSGKTRRRLAVELISELEAIDRRIKTVTKELTGLVTARGSTLLDLHGIGPSGAARLLADLGDIHRFADRDKFASWNGTAPLDAARRPSVHRRDRPHKPGGLALKHPRFGRCGSFARPPWRRSRFS